MKFILDLLPKFGFGFHSSSIMILQHPDDNISPAQEALLHVQSKIADLGPDEDAVITSRLLIPANQVGCLLGKGGSIIAEMRRLTRANIRILGKDDLPKCASSDYELVQVFSIFSELQNIFYLCMLWICLI